MENNQNIQTSDGLTEAIGNALGIPTQNTEPIATEDAGATTEEATQMQESQSEPQANQNQTTQERDNPVRQLRAQYDAQKKQLEERTNLLERIAKTRGLSSIDDLVNKLQEEEDKARATSRNIPIEVQQQIRQQEEKIKALEIQNLKANYQARELQLRNQFNLSEQQMFEFAKQAESLGFNVFTPDLNLSTLYKAINYDKLEQDLRSKIRQEVLTELQNNNNANTIRQGTSVTPASSSNNDVSPEEFFKQLFK